MAIAEVRGHELAELLSLPPGLHGQSFVRNVRPRTVGEVRVLHTHLSRTLGRTYRERWGLILRCQPESIELMQRILHVRFPSAALRSTDDVSDVYAHGALLSEILVRTYRAEWVDIDHRDFTRWRVVAPNGKTIAPFGRTLGFVLGDSGRDLSRCVDDLAA